MSVRVCVREREFVCVYVFMHEHVHSVCVYTGDKICLHFYRIHSV